MTHKVTLQPSGHQFEVPDGVTILDAGLKAKFFMPYSCRMGTCRTCRGVMEEGTVDSGFVHPHCLSEADCPSPASGNHQPDVDHWENWQCWKVPHRDRVPAIMK